MNIKVEIINLRREGLSYNAIAQQLNISKDQVAKYPNKTGGGYKVRESRLFKTKEEA